VTCSVTRIRRGLRRLPQLRRLLRNSGELFRRRRSSLAEGEHTIAFVSSIPFRFAVQSTVSWSFPSNPLCLLFLCLYPSSRTLPSAAAVLDSAASFVPAAGEHSYEIPSTSSLRSEPQSDPSPPSSSATRALGALELLTSCTSVPRRMEVEDKVVLRLGPWTFL
jgi:hypothetical protein